MFRSIEAWFEEAADNGLDLAEAVLAREVKNTGASPEEIRERIGATLRVMEEAVEQGLNDDTPSSTGMTGGRSGRLLRSTGGFFGSEFTGMLARAIATLEVNAHMGLIVAAPTAGAAGVLPAVLLTLRGSRGWSENRVVDGMLVAGGVGAVIAQRASISGAGGGCQAETGSAAAMAAATVAYLEGGSHDQVRQAIGLTLQGMLGLICDPVAGLVEIPCAYRNATAAVHAVAGAEMALAGLDFPIAVDEVIDVMGEVGRGMNVRFRETALGGLAATPSGRRIAREAGMSELVELQKRGTAQGERSARLGPS
jgi:L-serine dehydratase